MKKGMMIIGNIVIFLAVLAFVLLDVGSERQRMLASKTEAFENMTVAMESVTTNYLLGEQQVCNSWANYINANQMTEEEAIAFVRDSVSTPGDYRVSYKNVDIFSSNFDDLLSENGAVSVTRAYTNPVNAIQSIAFCRHVRIRDSQSGLMREAALLRVIPVSAFAQRWSFPTKDYQNAEISLIDLSGGYVIKGHSFKNSNFYQFYQSYNEFSAAIQEKQAKRMVTPCVDMPLDGVYAAFGELDEKRVVNLSELGLADAPDSQARRAGWQVSNFNMTVDEAVKAFGTLE